MRPQTTDIGVTPLRLIACSYDIAATPMLLDEQRGHPDAPGEPAETEASWDCRCALPQ